MRNAGFVNDDNDVNGNGKNRVVSLLNGIGFPNQYSLLGNNTGTGTNHSIKMLYVLNYKCS